jgi:hypothetical protein
MSVSALLHVAMGVSADAFAVAVGKGLTMRRLHRPTAVSIAVAFAVAQSLMSFVGGGSTRSSGAARAALLLTVRPECSTPGGPRVAVRTRRRDRRRAAWRTTSCP